MQPGAGQAGIRTPDSDSSAHVEGQEGVHSEGTDCAEPQAGLGRAEAKGVTVPGWGGGEKASRASRLVGSKAREVGKEAGVCPALNAMPRSSDQLSQQPGEDTTAALPLTEPPGQAARPPWVPVCLSGVLP